MNYRKEINGLRAIAISVVLVYHFNPHILKHGYLGVDMFFVISGFLLTHYIYKESLNSKFLFWTFYKRRIIRILPITLVVLFFCLIASKFILVDSDFDRFLESFIASLSFVANIFFWKTGGYFGESDSLKPLLHIWSLSVEEQYYLIFPFLFFLILKLSKSFRFVIISFFFILIISFFLNFYLISKGGSSPAFFFFLFRIWEFISGSIAALFYYKFKRTHTYLSLTISILLILIGLTNELRFFVPGSILVIGTAFFLSMNYRPLWFFDVLFKSNFVCNLGLISFSTYLWHWPIIVFVNYISINSPNNILLVAAFLSTYILSAISYKYVEQPFRYNINQKLVVFISLGFTVLLIIFAFILLNRNSIKKNENLANKIAASIQTNYRCSSFNYRLYDTHRACLINKNAANNFSLALVGNSHAQMYAPVIENKLKKKDEKGLLVPLKDGCLPTIEINISTKCLQLSKKVLDFVANDKQISTVIIGLTWYNDYFVNSLGVNIEDKNKLKLSMDILNLINILEAKGKKVFLIGPLMIPEYNLASILSRKIKFNNISNEEINNFIKADYQKFSSRFELSTNFLKSKLGARFIMPTEVFCKKNFCYFGDYNGIFYSDSNHLGSYGVSKLEDLFNVINYLDK